MFLSCVIVFWQPQRDLLWSLYPAEVFAEEFVMAVLYQRDICVRVRY